MERFLRYNYRSKLLLRCVMCFYIIFNLGCVEPFEGAVDSFEDVLVVNAIITNQVKRQEINLTRSYPFEEQEVPLERNAMVRVSGSDGASYLFEETEPGLYKSIQEFGAQMNVEYTLNIETENGRVYQSTAMQLPVSSTTIDEVSIERTFNNEGIEGIAINVDSFDPLGVSQYYRHDYIETFKIIAPLWSPFDAVFVIEGINQYEIPVIHREQEERICYGTNKSGNINVLSTRGFVEDRLEDYNVRFINRDEYVLTHRYSILVQQYVLAPETFAYYDTLKGLTQSSTTLFSEDQPGFLAGNIFSLTDDEENVAGYFEVSALDEQRFFFNWEDYFPGEDLPPYIIPCSFLKPSSYGIKGERDLVNIIRQGTMRFYDFNTNPQPGEGEYIMVLPECGDCTVLGSNIIPDFWVE